MTVTFRLTYPPIVNKFLQWLVIFEFLNIFHFAFIPNCLYTMDYYDQLAGKVLGPSFVLLVCYFGFKLTKQRWMYEIFLVLSFVCYPSFCDSLFLFFDCKRYEDGENYLVMHPDIKCTDSKWLWYRYPVAVMGFILPFGIIVLYFMELVGNRQALWPKAFTPEEVNGDDFKRIPCTIIIAAGDSSSPQGHVSCRRPSKILSASCREFAKAVLSCEEEIGVTKEEVVEAFNAQKEDAGTDHAVEWLQIILREARGDAEHLRFLYASYKPQFYWFEAFEMLRKFSLTGLPLLTRLVSQGSNTESVWGTMLTAGFTNYVNSIAPYIDENDQMLSLCTQFHLVTTMIAGMGNGVMEPSGGSDIFITVSVIVPAVVLMSILVYGIIDPEYKTWFARKCVSVGWVLVSVPFTNPVLSVLGDHEPGSDDDLSGGDLDFGNPMHDTVTRTELSNMTLQSMEAVSSNGATLATESDSGQRFSAVEEDKGDGDYDDGPVGDEWFNTGPTVSREEEAAAAVAAERDFKLESEFRANLNIARD
jgi:hypothetical protein